eukprot:symbB.v1.2.039742.t1/scaffold6761.1/size24966/1
MGRSTLLRCRWLLAAATVAFLAVPHRLNVALVGGESEQETQVPSGALEQLLGSVEASLQPLREEVVVDSQHCEWIW